MLVTHSMSWSAWSVRLWVLALLASMQLALGGCARSYPEVRGVADADFAGQRHAVRTLDVLPVDLQLWTKPERAGQLQSISQRLDTNMTGYVSTELSRRGYRAAMLDWDGAYRAAGGSRYQALTPTEVVETNYVLSSYGRAVAQAKRGLLVPHLPHRLGTRTGADATLYVGGWAYAGNEPEPTGHKVAKGIAIGLLVVAVIAIVVIAAKKGGGGGSGLGGLGKTAAKAGKTAAHVASGMARAAARAGAHLARGAVRVTADVLEGMSRVDCFGRTNTHISVHGGRPNYYRQSDTPRKGDSQMYVEMTLVDNDSGEVLWHARQRFNAHAQDSGQVRTVIERMLASMPAAR